MCDSSDVCHVRFLAQPRHVVTRNIFAFPVFGLGISSSVLISGSLNHKSDPAHLFLCVCVWGSVFDPENIQR